MSIDENSHKISFIGDLLLADTDYSIGSGIFSRIKFLIDYYSSEKNSLFPDSDFVISNLESPILVDVSEVLLPFGSKTEAVGLLKKMSVSMLSVANNHILDHGQKGFKETLHTLSENKIGVIGQKRDGISTFKKITIKNKTISLASFNVVKDHNDEDQIAYIEKETLVNTIAEIKKTKSDYIFFVFHWGNEYVNIPSPSQVELAHEMIDMGIDIIIGHHPHVIQPVERYKNGLIFYSLGNFLFDMFWSENVRNGIVAEILLGDNNTIDYNIRHFRIRSDFTIDTVNTRNGVKLLAKADEKFRKMLEMPVDKYENEYNAECKRRRLNARILMKIYLIRNFFSLSIESRKFLLKKFRVHLAEIWKKN